MDFIITLLILSNPSISEASLPNQLAVIEAAEEPAPPTPPVKKEVVLIEASIAPTFADELWAWLNRQCTDYSEIEAVETYKPIQTGRRMQNLHRRLHLYNG